MRICQNVFVFADSFPIFFSLLLLSFFSPFLFSLSSTLYPFLSTRKVLASALLKTWKWNTDQLGDLAYFTTNFAPKIGHVFSGIALPEFGRRIFKMDIRMDGSVLAVLAAYQNNLVTSKMMTSQVAQWFPTLTSRKYNS